MKMKSIHRASNRTTMELKEPNFFSMTMNSTSNRTTMELKDDESSTLRRFCLLLIEPLWN